MIEQPLNAIDSVMRTMMDEDVMPGAVTLVARSGHIVQHEAYGHALKYDKEGKQVDDPVQMSEDTIFDIASLSKILPPSRR